MVIKRICAAFLTVLLALAGACLCLGAGEDVLTISRAYIYMPEITVEIKGTGYDAKDFSAVLDNEALTVQSATAFAPKTNAVCAYAVVDLSSSMIRSGDAVKKCLTQYASNMGANDHLVLIAFGETVDVVLKGGESKADIDKAISKLEFNKGGTLFYEALSKAYQLAGARQSNFDREYVLAFSDGMDYQKGSATFREVSEAYQTHMLPLYAVCAPNASQDAADKFGELARSSGGAILMLSDKPESLFSSFLDSINDVTILKLKAAGNMADGSTKLLSMKAGIQQADLQIPVTRSIPDTAPPCVDHITFDAESNTFSIHFTKNVLHADQPSAYDVTDSRGKKLSVASATYDSGSQTAVLKMENRVPNGKYTIHLNGIADASVEANKVTADQEITVEGAARQASLPWIVLGIIGGVVLLGLLLTILLVVLKRQKESNEHREEPVIEIPIQEALPQIEKEYGGGVGLKVKHHVKAPSAIHVIMKVKTGKTTEQTITADIVSSLIVGRSDACDIYVDDVKMSRQHFVLENDKGTLFVSDLESTNGTLLNGIKIGSRQRVLNGDKIYAGLSDIYVNFEK